MPGSADVSGLNVQFGALDFGSESALPDFGQPENCSSEATRETAVPVPQTQSSLYPKPIRSVKRENCFFFCPYHGFIKRILPLKPLEQAWERFLGFLMIVA